MIFSKKHLFAVLMLLIVLLPLTSSAEVSGGAEATSQPSPASGGFYDSANPAPASGGTNGGGSMPKLSNPLQNVTSIGALVNKFIEIISYLLIIFAVLMIVYTGLQFILARGNPEKMKEESKRLGWILIGVAVVIGARILVSVIINTLEATGTLSPQVTNQIQKAAQGK